MEKQLEYIGQKLQYLQLYINLGPSPQNFIAIAQEVQVLEQQMAILWAERANTSYASSQNHTFFSHLNDTHDKASTTLSQKSYTTPSTNPPLPPSKTHIPKHTGSTPTPPSSSSNSKWMTKKESDEWWERVLPNLYN